MLKIFRKKGVMKKILWVLAVVIILSFGVFANIHLLKERRNPSYAGKIFGKKIELKEFRLNYYQTQIQALMQYGENFEKIKEFLNLEAETWDRLILLYEANKRKIKVSDDEVIKAIQNYSFFKRDGRFDNALYKNILLNVFGIPVKEFEKGIRDSLKFLKLYQEETADVILSDAEILDAYKLQNEKAQISYILFPAEKYINQIPSDEIQAKDYYLTHREEFVQPQTINVEYIRIDSPKDENTPEPETQEESEETQLDNDTIEDEKADEEKEAAYTKASEILDELQANPNFKIVAEKYDLTSEQSGFFSMEQPNLTLGWPFPLIQQIFQVEQGQILGPVETLEGYQIIRVIEKKEAYSPEYEETKVKVMDAWRLEEAKKLAKQEAEKFSKTLQEIFNNVKRPNFAQIAKDNNLEIYQTPIFSRGQYLPQVGLSRDFQEAAFSLDDENKVSNVLQIEKGSCILHLDEVVPVDLEEFEKEKEKFAQGILVEKKNETFSNFLTYLRLKANLENNLPNLRAQQEQPVD